MVAIEMYCNKKSHKAKVLVENAILETNVATKKPGKTINLYRGICPNDGNKLTMIAKGTGLSGGGVEATQPTSPPVVETKMYTPDQVIDDNEINNKALQVIAKGLGKHSQVGAGIETLLLGLAPSVIPLIPDIVRGLGGLFGNGFTFPDNRQGSGFTFPDNKWNNGIAGTGLRDPVNEIVMPVDSVVNTPQGAYRRRRRRIVPGSLLSNNNPTTSPVLTNETLIGSLGRTASGAGLRLNKDPVKELAKIADSILKTK